MPKEYKKPDLKAPRFRPKKLNFTNKEFYDKFAHLIVDVDTK